MLSYEETANELIQVTLKLQELWIYNPDNPDHKDLREEFNQLLDKKNAMEKHLLELEKAEGNA